MQGVRWDAGQEWVKGSCLETWPKYNSGGLLQGQGGCQVCSYLLKGDGSPVCPTKGSLRGEEALLGGCEESARQGQMPTARGIQDKVMVRMGVWGGLMLPKEIPSVMYRHTVSPASNPHLPKVAS